MRNERPERREGETAEAHHQRVEEYERELTERRQELVEDASIRMAVMIFAISRANGSGCTPEKALTDAKVFVEHLARTLGDGALRRVG